MSFTGCRIFFFFFFFSSRRRHTRLQGDWSSDVCSSDLTLAGNSLQLDDQTPHLSQLRGVVKFSETGFSLAGLQARALGGELRADGGMQALARNAPATESSVKVRVQGTATAQGLPEARELGWV